MAGIVLKKSLQRALSTPRGFHIGIFCKPFSWLFFTKVKGPRLIAINMKEGGAFCLRFSDVRGKEASAIIGLDSIESGPAAEEARIHTPLLNIYTLPSPMKQLVKVPKR